MLNKISMYVVGALLIIILIMGGYIFYQNKKINNIDNFYVKRIESINKAHDKSMTQKSRMIDRVEKYYKKRLHDIETLSNEKQREHDKQIADLKKANEVNYNELIKKYEKREVLLNSNISNANDELERMHKHIEGLPNCTRDVPITTPTTPHRSRYTESEKTVLKECTTRLIEVATDAQRLGNDLIKLDDNQKLIIENYNKK